MFCRSHIQYVPNLYSTDPIWGTVYVLLICFAFMLHTSTPQARVLLLLLSASHSLFERIKRKGIDSRSPRSVSIYILALNLDFPKEGGQYNAMLLIVVFSYRSTCASPFTPFIIKLPLLFPSEIRPFLPSTIVQPLSTEPCLL